MPISKSLSCQQIFSFRSLSISNDGVLGLSAIVRFSVSDGNGGQYPDAMLRYSGADYNTFWANFNTGTYLYDELAKAQGVSLPAPNSEESEFVNQ